MTDLQNKYDRVLAKCSFYVKRNRTAPVIAYPYTGSTKSRIDRLSDVGTDWDIILSYIHPLFGIFAMDCLGNAKVCSPFDNFSCFNCNTYLLTYQWKRLIPKIIMRFRTDLLDIPGYNGGLSKLTRQAVIFEKCTPVNSIIIFLPWQ